MGYSIYFENLPPITLSLNADNRMPFPIELQKYSRIPVQYLTETHFKYVVLFHNGSTTLLNNVQKILFKFVTIFSTTNYGVWEKLSIDLQTCIESVSKPAMDRVLNGIEDS
ncbi:hypothetical protein CEXT_671461 [Caerostris extrusa]|uniref:Uncharacterized protein n=1 Tax=Caerostris extrusa TaxID=172846 RepID=A0AAV4RV62_CAEEX|nr:hypothetical protein CEXT_671461 [Caerostris extrusa]